MIYRKLFHWHIACSQLRTVHEADKFEVSFMIFWVFDASSFSHCFRKLYHLMIFSCVLKYFSVAQLFIDLENQSSGTVLHVVFSETEIKNPTNLFTIFCQFGWNRLIYFDVVVRKSFNKLLIPRWKKKKCVWIFNDGGKFFLNPVYYHWVFFIIVCVCPLWPTLNLFILYYLF